MDQPQLYPPHRHRQIRTLIVYALVLLLVGLCCAIVTQRQVEARPRLQASAMSFGAGRALQVIDPAGHNTFPFWTTGNSTVDFSLHRLDPAGFLQRYALYSPYNPTPIDVTALPVALQWQQHFSATAESTLRLVELPFDGGAALPLGLYVIRATNQQSGTITALVVISRHVLVVKRGAGGQVVVWATDLQQRTPIAGMTVTLYDRAGQPLGQGVTSSTGLVTLTIGTATPQMAVGEVTTAAGSDTTMAGLDWQWRIEDTRWVWAEPVAQQYRLYLHTDRPIYRPGQTIYYQTLIRHNRTTGYALPDPAELVTVRLLDSRGNVVETIEALGDAFGAMDGAFVLSDEPPLGRYQLEAIVAGEQTRQTLYVEAYRKPEYAVAVNAPAAFAISGDPVPLTVDATYFFGQPVTGAAVEMKIYRERRSRDWAWWWRDTVEHENPAEPIQTFRGTTDNQGRWHTTITPTTDEGYDIQYTVQATVTDARGEPLLGVTTLTVYQHTVALTVQTERYGYRHDEAVALQLNTKTHDKRPEAGKQVTVRIVHPTANATDTDVVPPQQVTTAADGAATATFAALPAGWYRVLATTTDQRNQTVAAETYLWIYGADGEILSPTGTQELTIMADRATYAPGDVAQLLIQSPVTGTALLALERAGVHHEQLVAINGPLTTVALPITADFAPNIFAQLHLFAPATAHAQPNRTGEGQLLTAQTELSVPATAQHLQVTVTSGAQPYAPGASAQLSIQVTDQQGAPVHARIALALVDEAIYALQPDLAGDLFAHFHGPAPHQIATFETLARQTAQTFYPPVDDRNGPLPTETDGDAATARQTRHNFQDTAYWNPHIETAADGRATISIILPDNLTTWRVVARAITAATAVGESQSALLVTQPLLARPVLPRFARLGDQFQSSVVAQNFTSNSTGGWLALTSPQLTFLEPSQQSINLATGGSAVARWTTVASQLGTGVVTTTLATAAGADQIAVPFLIEPFSVPERWTAAGIAAPMATETFMLPFNAINEATSLTVQLAPALALGVLDGLADLIDYPYGCVEQTMSRILPSAVAERAFATLGIANPKADELPTIISQGLQKLYGFQHSDGSWGWFYDDDGGVYLTAYVLFGLTQVQATGASVADEVLARGFAYLDRHLATVDDAGTKAYALYVKAVAGRGDLPQAQALVGDRNRLKTAALATLTLALAHDGDAANAQLVAATLLTQVSESGATAYWPLPDADWGWQQWQTMASAEKNTALALRALLAVQPDHPLLPKVVRWLMQAREGAGWRNTQATAFAVLGLVDYSQAHQELDASYSYRVLLNGSEVLAGQVTHATSRQPIASLVIPGTALPTGQNTLQFERSAATAPLYYSVQLAQEHFYDSFNPAAAVDQGIALARSYRLIEGQARGDGAYNVGDLVEVTLKLNTAERMAYVLVEEPIPAGFEALNERLSPVSYGDESPFFWQEWGYNRKNVRDDRVDFFLTTLWPGETVLTYLMRAKTPGIFGVSPGQAYPMYNDEFWGRSAGLVMRVAPEVLAQRPTLRGDFDGDCRISHFDAQLVAAAWGTSASQRNVIADAQIDLRDIAAVVARVGATCLQDQQIPTAVDEQVALTLNINHQQRQLGDQIAVTIRQSRLATAADAASTLGGYSIMLHFNPALLQVADVQWHQQGVHTLPLGPQINPIAGRVQVGAYGFATQPAKIDEALVTIIFVGRAVGTTTIVAVAGEAVDGQGRHLQAVVAATEGTITIEGEELFLPTVHR